MRFVKRRKGARIERRKVGKKDILRFFPPLFLCFPSSLHPFLFPFCASWVGSCTPHTSVSQSTSARLQLLTHFWVQSFPHYLLVSHQCPQWWEPFLFVPTDRVPTTALHMSPVCLGTNRKGSHHKHLAANLNLHAVILAVLGQTEHSFCPCSSDGAFCYSSDAQRCTTLSCHACRTCTCWQSGTSWQA